MASPVKKVSLLEAPSWKRSSEVVAPAARIWEHRQPRDHTVVTSPPRDGGGDDDVAQTIRTSSRRKSIALKSTAKQTREAVVLPTGSIPFEDNTTLWVLERKNNPIVSVKNDIAPPRATEVCGRVMETTFST